MNDQENEPLEPPPNNDIAFIKKIFWLFAAFIPSVIGIAVLHWPTIAVLSLVPLFILNMLCSLGVVIALLYDTKLEGILLMLVGMILVPGFFVLNVMIVIFVGCSNSHGGRISP